MTIGVAWRLGFGGAKLLKNHEESMEPMVRGELKVALEFSEKLPPTPSDDFGIWEFSHFGVNLECEISKFPNSM